MKKKEIKKRIKYIREDLDALRLDLDAESSYHHDPKYVNDRFKDYSRTVKGIIDYLDLIEL